MWVCGGDGHEKLCVCVCVWRTEWVSEWVRVFVCLSIYAWLCVCVRVLLSLSHVAKGSVAKKLLKKSPKARWALTATRWRLLLLLHTHWTGFATTKLRWKKAGQTSKQTNKDGLKKRRGEGVGGDNDEIADNEKYSWRSFFLQINLLQVKLPSPISKSLLWQLLRKKNFPIFFVWNDFAWADLFLFYFRTNF